MTFLLGVDIPIIKIPIIKKETKQCFVRVECRDVALLRLHGVEKKVG